MRLEKLAAGVYRVPAVPPAIVNAFLIELPSGGLTLVDAGMGMTARRLVRAAGVLGRPPTDLVSVLLTHGHTDHAGGAARIVAATGAAVLAHADDVAACADGCPPDSDTSIAGGRLANRFPMRYDAVAVDRTVADGEVLEGGLRIIHTPGHTPGHVAVLHEPSGVLITGDALINPLFVRYPFSMFCSRLEDMRRSAARIAEHDFEVAAFAHGYPVRRDAARRIRDALARRG